MLKINKLYSAARLFTLCTAPLFVGACAKTDGAQDALTTQTADSNGKFEGNSAGSGGSQTVASEIPAAIAPICKVATQNDAIISVTSKLGPHTAAPITFSNKLLSQNIDDQFPQDWSPTLDSNFVNLLAALRPALLRFPSGHYGQQYQFSPGGGKVNGQQPLTPAYIDQFMSLCSAVGAKPLLAINASGTLSNAQDFVRYVNMTKKYGVTWWHIGNEPDLDGVTATQSPTKYAATFNQFAAGMRSVDPTIKIVGAEIMTGADIIPMSGRTDWMTPILQGTQSAPMDAIDWHYYPLDSSQTLAASSATVTFSHLLQESAEDWPPAGLNFAGQVTPLLTKLRDQYAPKAEIWIDEFAEDSGVANGGGSGDTVGGSIWAADVIGRFAEQGTNAIFRFLFKGLNKSDKTDQKYALVDASMTPRPEYYTYWLYAQQFGDAMIRATSTAQQTVSVHGGVRESDGSVRLMVANKTEQSRTVRITFADFSPRVATQWVLSGGGTFAAKAATLNGKTFTGASVASGSKAIPAEQTANACQDNSIILKPASVTMLVFYP